MKKIEAENRIRAIKETGEVVYFTSDEVLRRDKKIPTWFWKCKNIRIVNK